MLVYEKVNETLRELFGTEANIPAEADKKIVFRDEAGAIVEVSRASKLFDDKHGGMLLEVNGQRKFVAMFIGEDATVAIVPKGWQRPAVAAPKRSKKAAEKVEE